MSNTNTGGPAFPMNWVKQEAPNLNVILEQRGMTLRDYFAAAALPAAIQEMNEAESYEIDDAAIVAYQYADAMMRVRNAAQ